MLGVDQPPVVPEEPLCRRGRHPGDTPRVSTTQSTGHVKRQTPKFSNSGMTPAGLHQTARKALKVL